MKYILKYAFLAIAMFSMSLLMIPLIGIVVGLLMSLF